MLQAVGTASTKSRDRSVLGTLEHHKQGSLVGCSPGTEGEYQKCEWRGSQRSLIWGHPYHVSLAPAHSEHLINVS